MIKEAFTYLNARPYLIGILIVLCLFVIIGSSNQSGAPPVIPPKISAYFSPNGGCISAIVTEIGKAKKEVLVQAYSFGSNDIINALISANSPKVKVEVIQDSGQHKKNTSTLDKLSKAGITTYIDGFHCKVDKDAAANNKIIIIDGQTLITGSFNFIKLADTANAENLLIIKDAPELLKEYLDNYLKHKEHSVEYKTGK